MNNPQPKQLAGKGFTKGDPRINRLGRPKHFDAFRKLAQRISHEKVIGPDGDTLTRAEAILRSWAKSKQPALQLAFIAYCYGRPPEKVEVDQLENKTVLLLHFRHELEGDAKGSRLFTRFAQSANEQPELRKDLQPPEDEGGALPGEGTPLLPDAD